MVDADCTAAANVQHGKGLNAFFADFGTTQR